MWDLLSKRYASPFAYIDGLLKFGDIAEGLKTTLKQVDEDQLWDLYLHSFPKEPFNDWKKKVLVEPISGLSEAEIATQVKISNNILKAVKPS